MIKWKSVILEDFIPTSKYQLYCDLDGVLVNFEKGAEEIVNDAIQEVHKNIRYYSNLDRDNKNPEYIKFKLAKKVANVKGWNHYYVWDEINKEGKNHIKPLRNLMYFLASRNKSWWINLEWAPGGRKLWSFIKPYSPIILTSGMGSKSEIGKRVWCQRELGLSGDRVLVVDNKGIPTGDKIGILIDDRTKPLGQFKGIGILYKTGNPQAAIEELKQYGFE